VNRALLNNDNYFKMYYIKVEHSFNKIVINHDNSIKESAASFHQKDGLPIKLSIESFLVILIRCSHNILHEFKNPIEPEIEWKIVNGIKDGAFKHGFGANTKYSDGDCDTSVIYYPPNEGIGNKGENQPKEIPILIKIKSSSHKELNNTDLSKNATDVNNIELNDFENYQFLLTLFLKHKKGFFKRMFYDVSLTVKKTGFDSNLNNFSNSPTYKMKQHNFNLSFMDNSYTKEEDENIYSVSQKHSNNCSYCNLCLAFKPELELSSYLDKLKINIDTNRFFTSEFIKISSSIPYDGNTDKNILYQLLCTIKNKDKDICKFRVINCPPIRVNQHIWSCTAGSFPCDNKGNCVIYCSPQENELSKSPVTLSLYEKNIFDGDYGKQLSLVDQKKIWLLRRNIMGG